MSGGKKPVVAFTRFTPYLVIDMERIEKPDGEFIELLPVASLCRCGESKNKPFCDGSHSVKGIDGEKNPERIPYKWKEYSGRKITVHFNLSLCSHDGSCVRMLPEVFNITRRPWIYPDNAETEELIETIKNCPSGALSYTLNGQKFTDYHNGETKIKLRERGPLEFYGGIKLKDDQGSKPEAADHYTLCRCGRSRNKPFCDGIHQKFRFSGS